MNTRKRRSRDPKLTPAKRRQLTAHFVATVRPTARRETYPDALCPGLKLRVTPSGARTFSLVLPGRNGKAQQRLSWSWPEHTLHDAREAALEARRAHERGAPVLLTAKQRAAIAADGAGTVNWLLDQYCAEHAPRLRDHHDVVASIERHLRPALGAIPLAVVSKQDIRRMVATVKQRGPVIASSMLRQARAIFRWGMAEDLCERDPSFGLKSAPVEPRQRILSDSELAAVWRASLTLGYPAGDLVRLLILTGARRDEGREAHWREVDLAGRDWLIPAERFKAKRPHLIPLTDTLGERLENLPYRDRNLFLFSARASGARAFQNMNKPKAKLDLLSGVEGWVWHDLRRTLRSGLSKLGVPPYVAEKVIGHSDTKLMRTYDVHDYRSEKLAALTAWDHHVARLTAAPSKIS